MFESKSIYDGTNINEFILTYMFGNAFLSNNGIVDNNDINIIEPNNG